MPPLWKIKRELRRIGRQISRQFMIRREPARQRLHDTVHYPTMRRTAGKLQPGSKVAVFVLFQPRGLARSILLTCDELVANGYTPLIVSNAELSSQDRADLATRAFRVLERRNFGYDFGAYRDALRFLKERGLAPETLVLMNDSTWFPLRRNDPALARLEALGDGFTGLSYKYEPAIGLGWPHVESHFLMFRKPVLESAAFKTFWAEYIATDSRDETIQRGEKGITRAMFDAGFETEALASRAQLLALFARLDAPALRQVIEEAAIHLDPVVARRAALLAQAGAAAEGDAAEDAAGEDWADAARAFLDEMLEDTYFPHSSSLFYATATYLHLPYLKKSGEYRFHLAREKVLDLAARGLIPPLDPVVEAELRARVETFDVTQEMIGGRATDPRKRNPRFREGAEP